ncbi:hypothetical protein AS189_07010 [Arthrobacter alpinus]|uniref:SGNH hydrolase-type esterase domain-containing protein n=2 Tax=Arthrobacter alpinus TaxID=656366 RepID=A0A0S2LXL7_9MICC|nr:hypothetical protein AS189_07010 [Arthrobacter alpinus]
MGRRKISRSLGALIAAAVVLLALPPSAVVSIPATMPSASATTEATPVNGPSPTPVIGPVSAAVGDSLTHSLVLNPASGRYESVDANIASTAVLIGDSQSAGAAGVRAADTWVERGLSYGGYAVKFVGASGTGFTRSSARFGNYPDALEKGQMVLPHGNPALVVVQGGGNDAAAGATDAEILANAGRLLRGLKESYPNSQFLFIGTLARGGKAGGRRNEVDMLVAGFAHRNGAYFISAGDWLTRYELSNKMADGVHLTLEGHQILGKVLASRLKDLKLLGPKLH